MIGWAFTVPGVPKPRQRARVVRLRSGKSHTYTPERTVNFEWKVASAAQAAGVQVLEGPVGLEIEIVRPWPKSLSKKAIAAGAWPTTRPDMSNILGAIEDALIGVAYLDDAQIVNEVVRKVYGPAPCVQVSVGPYPWLGALDEGGLQKLLPPRRLELEA